MSGTTASVWLDSIQLMRIEGAFPGRQFRYWADESKEPVEYFGIIEGDPSSEADRDALAMLMREIGGLNVTLVLGPHMWVPSRAGRRELAEKLRKVKGRTPEEAAAFLAKADELEQS